MAVTEKNILNRLYFVVACLFLFAGAILFKLVNIQMVQGDKYQEMAMQLDALKGGRALAHLS